MITYLPDFLPDELFYSYVARYHHESGNISLRQTQSQVYSKIRNYFDISFIGDINDNFYNSIKNKKDYKDIILGNTLLPFYIFFKKASFKENVYKKMYNRNTKVEGDLRVGSKYNVKLKYCPLCVKEDKNKYGVSYWHRIHQIPIIDVCPLHFCNLVQVDLSISRNRAYQLIPLEIISNKKIEVKYSSDLTAKISSYTNSIIRYFCFEDINVSNILKKKIDEKGYCKKSSILNDINKYYNGIYQFTESEITNIICGNNLNTALIIYIAIYLNISPEDLVIDGTEINSMSIHTVRITNKNTGTKYSEMDKKYYYIVKSIVKNWYISQRDEYPQRLTFSSIARAINVTNVTFMRLPKSYGLVRDNIEPYEMFLARKIIWAFLNLESTQTPINKSRINQLSKNFDNDKVLKSIPYIEKLRDVNTAQKIKELYNFKA